MSEEKMHSIPRGAAISVMAAMLLACSDRSANREWSGAEVVQNAAGSAAEGLCAGYRVAPDTALVPAPKETLLETVDVNSDGQAD